MKCIGHACLRSDTLIHAFALHTFLSEQAVKGAVLISFYPCGLSRAILPTLYSTPETKRQFWISAISPAGFYLN